MRSKPAMPAFRTFDGPIAALVISRTERNRLSMSSIGERIEFYAHADALNQRLAQDVVGAVVIETRDADGFPVPATIQPWVADHPHLPVVVWTGGGEATLREVLALTAGGGDIRLILRGRDDLALTVERILTQPTQLHPGAVPALLRHVVAPAPWVIQPDLTLAAYHAWPHPSVSAWALSLHVTRQALNARLGAAHFATARVVLDVFSAAEIAIRCAIGYRIRHIAEIMGRLDDRSLRRRMRLLGARPEQLRDESDFRALIPLIVERVNRMA
jgi:hypothetical protein